MIYEFKYRLSQKSSLAAIAKAVRALKIEMKIETDRGVSFIWYSKGPSGRSLYNNEFVLDENVPEWLNKRLEGEGLLKPLEQ